MISIIPWKQLAILFFLISSLLTFGGTLQHYKLKAAKAELATQKAELAAVIAQLADAKTAGEAAVKAKEKADAEAAKQLERERKKWKDLYAKDPEARAWADVPVPAGVLDRLRD